MMRFCQSMRRMVGRMEVMMERPRERRWQYHSLYKMLDVLVLPQIATVACATAPVQPGNIVRGALNAICHACTTFSAMRICMLESIMGMACSEVTDLLFGHQEQVCKSHAGRKKTGVHLRRGRSARA